MHAALGTVLKLKSNAMSTVGRPWDDLDIEKQTKFVSISIDIPSKFELPLVKLNPQRNNSIVIKAAKVVGILQNLEWDS